MYMQLTTGRGLVLAMGVSERLGQRVPTMKSEGGDDGKGPDVVVPYYITQTMGAVLFKPVPAKHPHTPPELRASTQKKTIGIRYHLRNRHI